MALKMLEDHSAGMRSIVVDCYVYVYTKNTDRIMQRCVESRYTCLSHYVNIVGSIISMRGDLDALPKMRYWSYMNNTSIKITSR